MNNDWLYIILYQMILWKCTCVYCSTNVCHESFKKIVCRKDCHCRLKCLSLHNVSFTIHTSSIVCSYYRIINYYCFKYDNIIVISTKSQSITNAIFSWHTVIVRNKKQMVHG